LGFVRAVRVVVRVVVRVAVRVVRLLLGLLKLLGLLVNVSKHLYVH
jgi:hypothetical protein